MEQESLQKVAMDTRIYRGEQIADFLPPERKQLFVDNPGCLLVVDGSNSRLVMPNEVVDKQTAIQQVVDLEKQYGIGVWAYFPGIRELPDDAKVIRGGFLVNNSAQSYMVVPSES